MGGDLIADGSPRLASEKDREEREEQHEQDGAVGSQPQALLSRARAAFAASTPMVSYGVPKIVRRSSRRPAS